MMRKFLADTRGVFAIEFAILMPVVLLAIGFGIAIAQKQSLRANTNFVVQAAALAGQSQVQTIVAANAALFLPGWTYTVSITPNSNNTFTVTLASVEPALWPIAGENVSATATVTVANQGAQ
jgi:Flp pilus assembly protein TadG